MNRRQRRKAKTTGHIPPKPDEPITKLQVQIPVVNIVLSNHSVRYKQVANLIKAVPKHLWPPVTAYWDGERHLLTDGNHRTTAALKRGDKTISAVILTKQEYDYVKCSNRKLQIIVEKDSSYEQH